MSITGKIKTLFADSAKTEALFPRTKTSAVSDDNGVGLNVILDNKQEKHKPVSVSLGASNWSNMEQTVNVGGVTANSTVVVTPAPDSHASYGDAGVYCFAQGNGTLTFKCDSTPSVALTVNVLILD